MLICNYYPKTKIAKGKTKMKIDYELLPTNDASLLAIDAELARL